MVGDGASDLWFELVIPTMFSGFALFNDLMNSLSPLTLIGVYGLLTIAVLYRYKVFNNFEFYRNAMKKQREAERVDIWMMPKRTKRSEIVPFSVRLLRILSKPFLICFYYLSLLSHDKDDEEVESYQPHRVWSQMNKLEILQGVHMIDENRAFLPCFLLHCLCIHLTYR
jgi:hypothetical protein